MVRRSSRSIPLKSFRIYCEGDCTEPNYISLFRSDNSSILINDGKERCAYGDPEGLKRLAKKALDDGKNNNASIRVWIVLDKDNNKNEDLKNLRSWCSDNNVGLAFSNPLFEYWLALHFSYIEGGQNKQDLFRFLSKHLNETYQKNKTYPIFRDHLDMAKKNAKNLRKSISEDNYCNHNPFTNVDLLIEDIERFIQEF